MDGVSAVRDNPYRDLTLPAASLMAFQERPIIFQRRDYTESLEIA